MENADNLLFMDRESGPTDETEDTEVQETPVPEVKTLELKLEATTLEEPVSKPVAAIPDPNQIHYVKFITSDFAMQNVIIQMGFQLLNLDGMRLTRVKRFKLLCKACNWLNTKTDLLFCAKCGSATLAKVSVYLNDNGDVTYFKNPKRKINLKGTIYSIPKAKGGRGCKDIILREDDLLKGEYS